MRIVRSLHGLRVLVALAVLSCVPLSASPAHAAAFAGECTISNLQFGSTLTPATVGGWSGGLSFSGAPCIYTSGLSSVMSGSGTVSGQVVSCGAGVLQSPFYDVTTAGISFEGSLSVVIEGAALSLIFNNGGLVFSGELVPTRLNAHNCPSGWTGVVAVVRT